MGDNTTKAPESNYPVPLTALDIIAICNEMFAVAPTEDNLRVAKAWDKLIMKDEKENGLQSHIKYEEPT